MKEQSVQKNRKHIKVMPTGPWSLYLHLPPIKDQDAAVPLCLSLRDEATNLRIKQGRERVIITQGRLLKPFHVLVLTASNLYNVLAL